MKELRRICVYCGSSNGVNPRYVEQAQALGKLLAARGIGLVYGGGGIGLMGACAEAARLAGGEVIGIIPQSLALRERLNELSTDLRIVHTMHERKSLMVELADGFIALPGGFGTFDELFETITWAQLGIHQKPIGVLNVEDYFAPFLALVERAVNEGFVLPKYQQLMQVSTDANDLLNRLSQHEPLAGLVQWLDLRET
ncbi:MAG: TIGR00730 family Rossman fold protein [Acidobacteria bacterium]|nr:TIGR00730 family Rossman fold protein [Acidobacteriota bacterium]MBI3424175.1 TIGR00730 family Rossman fold protein [Acidobacteriota bacterium]